MPLHWEAHLCSDFPSSRGRELPTACADQPSPTLGHILTSPPSHHSSSFRRHPCISQVTNPMSNLHWPLMSSHLTLRENPPPVLKPPGVLWSLEITVTGSPNNCNALLAHFPNHASFKLFPSSSKGLNDLLFKITFCLRTSHLPTVNEAWPGL